MRNIVFENALNDLVFIIYAAYFAMLLISIYAIRVCTQKKHSNLVRIKHSQSLFTNKFLFCPRKDTSKQNKVSDLRQQSCYEISQGKKVRKQQR